MKQGRTIIGGGLPEPAGAALPDDEAEAAEAASELREFAVGPGQHGLRLDQALAERVPEFSRSYLQQLVNGGAVTLGGRRAARPAQRVKAGDAIAIELRPTPQSLAFRPEPMPLAVVHEDEHLLVIDKPPGLVVHPAPGHWSGTLLNGLLARDPQAGLVPRAGIVHRLDKDTSGLMVVARTRAAMEALVRLIAAREVARQYLAIGLGRWQGPPDRTVDAPIGRDPRQRLRMAVVDLARHAGKPALTTFALLDNAADACLVRASLHTGRTHQIRVHMAHLGHPLAGDELYGGAAQARGGEGSLARQALHAFRLAFAHPFTGQPLAFTSPLPADFVHALSAWGLRYNPASALAPAATPAGPAAAPAGRQPR
ncbi:RluA family pseudouridine synthase [Ramlibacter sp.]|uniref:RluA family pseudouridine synthase n=1 Tax=Ramlibacter sp. TaxID=1917967 RepID=UPI003FA7DE22